MVWKDSYLCHHRRIRPSNRCRSPRRVCSLNSRIGDQRSCYPSCNRTRNTLIDLLSEMWAIIKDRAAEYQSLVRFLVRFQCNLYNLGYKCLIFLHILIFLMKFLIIYRKYLVLMVLMVLMPQSSMNLRLRVLVEAALIGVIPPAVGQLPIVDVVLAAPIAPDDADDDEQEDDEGQGQHHANEPTCIGHRLIGHHNRSLDAVRVHLLRGTLRVEVPIDGDDAELVGGLRIQTLHLLVVGVLLLWRPQPLRLTLDPRGGSK